MKYGCRGVTGLMVGLLMAVSAAEDALSSEEEQLPQEPSYKYAFAEPLHYPLFETEYVYEWNIEWRQTMTYYDADGHRHPIFYDVDKRDYYWRDKNQLQACDRLEPIGDKSVLDKIIPYAGLHQDVIALNGHTPARRVVVPFGSEVIFRVHNNLISESITIHVHGFDKTNLWYTDGVAHLQQCPIPPGSTYSYRFIADTVGTHWFHGHLGVDRAEGLVSAFIVMPKDDAYDRYDDQFVVVLQDWTVPTAHDVWYNHISESMKFLKGVDDLNECWAPTRTYDGTNIGGSVPLQAILVNARGWHNQTDILTRPWALPVERFKIRPGDEIMFRLISATSAQQLMVTIEDHPMTIVAADGAAVRETAVDKLILFAGERYDVIITAHDTPKRREFYVLFETLEYYAWDGALTKPFYGIAVIEYDIVGLAPNEERLPDFEHAHCQPQKHCVVMNCPFEQFPPQLPFRCMHAGDLRSASDVPADLLETSYDSGFEEHFLNMHFDSHVNGWRFVQPKAPPYFYPEDETQVAKPCLRSECPPNANRLAPGCFCFYHLNITLGNVVQLTVYNMGEGSEAGRGYSHPVHVHGTHFYLMKMGFPTYNATTGVQLRSNDDLPCNDPLNAKCNDARWTHPTWLNGNVAGMNTLNPSSRDTVVIPAGGYVVLRFKAINAGWFYAHCHVMIHHMGGMAFALRVGTRDQMAPPPDNFPRDCGHFEQPPLDPNYF